MKTYTTEEACKVLHCTRQTLSKKRRSGEVFGIRFGKSYIYDADLIDSLLANHIGTKEKTGAVHPVSSQTIIERYK